MSNKKVRRRRRKEVRIKRFICIAVIVILFITFLVCINSKRNPLVGKWTTEKGTIYQFNKDYTGKLILSIGEYEYKYEIKGDKVYVDFTSESSNDTEFIFKVDNDKLVLENKNGTFNFTKID